MFKKAHFARHWLSEFHSLKYLQNWGKGRRGVKMNFFFLKDIGMFLCVSETQGAICQDFLFKKEVFMGLLA